MTKIFLNNLDPETGKPWRLGIYIHDPYASVIRRLKSEALKKGIKPELILFSNVHIAVKSPRKFAIYVKNERYALPPVVINRLPASAAGLGL